jgi:hypothetical protein
MAKRKTAEERIKAHRAQADKLEAAAKLRALKASPAWRATFKAIDKMEEAMMLLAAADERDEDHLLALQSAFDPLNDIRVERFGSPGGAR